jgi:hypothetical protein
MSMEFRISLTMAAPDFSFSLKMLGHWRMH